MTESQESITMQGAVCPIPLSHDEQIVMGHGSGGKMSHDPIARFFAPSFKNPPCAQATMRAPSRQRFARASRSVPIRTWSRRCSSQLN